MSRRKLLTRRGRVGLIELFLLMLACGLPVMLVQAAVEWVQREWQNVLVGGLVIQVPLAIGGAIVVGVVVWVKAQDRAAAEAARLQREADLVARFGEEAARRILAKELWQGATREMVVEMLGPPASVDEKALKTKTKHTLKYFPQARRQYGLRVQLEDDLVVGWETSNG